MALDREILPADDSTASTTVVFDSNGGVAIDYSSFYERIATAMETIATSVSSIETMASGTGIKTQGVYDWVLLSSVYKLYVDDTGAIGLEAFTTYKDKIESLPKS